MDNQQLPAWSNRYIPTVISASDARACKQYGWVSPDAGIGIVNMQCTKGCRRYRGVSGEEDQFFTCGPCQSGSAFAKAKHTSFTPKTIEPVRHDCIGGCGRYCIVAEADRVGWLCCGVCSTSLRAFMQCMNGDRKQTARYQGRGGKRKYYYTRLKAE